MKTKVTSEMSKERKITMAAKFVLELNITFCGIHAKINQCLVEEEKFIFFRRHRWMHYMTDKTPLEEAPVQRKWIMEHEQNLSGTKDEYVPYSTTRTKIDSWTPPQN